jgi:hypothetical protein
MKVFISWSGENSASHKIAQVFHEWLPCVISNISPFVSSEDIQKGDRGLTRIQESLKDSGFGILCVTPENYKAPWLIFEAGALSHNPNNVPVTPFLFELKPSDLSGSPLNQLQATAYSSRDDILKFVKSINTTCGENRLEESIVEKRFEKFYPDLEEKLQDIKKELNATVKTEIKETDTTALILEEILDTVRNSYKALLSTALTDERLEMIINRANKKIMNIQTENKEISKKTYDRSLDRSLITKLVYIPALAKTAKDIAEIFDIIIELTLNHEISYYETIQILNTYFKEDSHARHIIMDENRFKTEFIKNINFDRFMRLIVMLRGLLPDDDTRFPYLNELFIYPLEYENVD